MLVAPPRPRCTASPPFPLSPPPPSPRHVLSRSSSTLHHAWLASCGQGQEKLFCIPCPCRNPSVLDASRPDNSVGWDAAPRFARFIQVSHSPLPCNKLFYYSTLQSSPLPTPSHNLTPAEPRYNPLDAHFTQFAPSRAEDLDHRLSRSLYTINFSVCESDKKALDQSFAGSGLAFNSLFHTIPVLQRIQPTTQQKKGAATCQPSCSQG
ncbi:hypothetical protein BDZ91DRAFT_743267 [Kalaharituber pfeilii]|nr:hypothetical protein BDZ91DRAFT_743267 [Kalaharituber pfeilii]